LNPGYPAYEAGYCAFGYDYRCMEQSRISVNLQSVISVIRKPSWTIRAGIIHMQLLDAFMIHRDTRFYTLSSVLCYSSPLNLKHSVVLVLPTSEFCEISSLVLSVLVTSN